MNIEYLVQLMMNRLAALTLAKDQAFQSGDLERINAVDAEILEVQNTLGQLQLVSGITAAAAATNTTAAEIVATGLDAVQNVSVQGPSAGAIVNGYDISAYATDPLHEQKIQNLISAMPPFNSIGDIDAYIQFAAPGSPVTGTMVQNAINLYAIDMLLLLAIMQNDSNFGTLGIGARTNNPGNVGNNGFEERSYPSWEEGVVAVAEWLSRHRYVAPEPVIAPPVAPEPAVEEPIKPKKKKAAPEESTPEPVTEPEPTPEVPPIEPPVEEATTTPPIIEETASTTPPVVVEDSGTTGTSTEPTP